MILFVNLQLDVLEHFLGLVSDLKSSCTGTNTDHADGTFLKDGMLLDTVAIKILVVPLILMNFIGSRHDSSFRGHTDLDEAF